MMAGPPSLGARAWGRPMNEHDDHGACLAEMILFTPAWAREFSPGALAERYAMTALFLREDREPQEPIGIQSLSRVAELIAELNPPLVTIRSATGEDIDALKRLVELAKANGAVH